MILPICEGARPVDIVSAYKVNGGNCLKILWFILVQPGHYSSPKSNRPGIVLLHDVEGNNWLVYIDQSLPRKGTRCILRAGTLEDESGVELKPLRRNRRD
jgi:hypothetical protein